VTALAELVATGGARVQEHAPIGPRTTYRVGGSVRALVTLSTKDDLEELGPLLRDSSLPLFVLGNGSNLLVADGEQPVIGVHLTGEFQSLTWRDVDGAVVVEAGAALDLPVAARRLSSDGVVGFEWAVGVPGTFGGAAVMNAGGHGSDMAACVRRVRTWRDGDHEWTLAQLRYGYRTSALRADDLVTAVIMELARGDADAAQASLRQIVRWRREHQPGGANGGSVFANPAGDHAGRLIDEARCKGLRVGSAFVSDKHANFIIVEPGGRARDVYELIVAIRRRVRESSGVELALEHRLLGFEGTP
jgi:UDP-N-acetylmuramate dehydrogenase